MNAGYAADGYARIKGLGVVVTTFGVGELSAINAIAGAYAERAPVVHVVGTPSREIQDSRTRVHHTFNDGNFTRFSQMHAQITVAQANLRDKESAPAEIDTVLLACLKQSRPVYISIPTDMVAVHVDAQRLATPIQLPEIRPTKTTDAIVQSILDKISTAMKPAILVDGECRALGISQEVQEIVASISWPTWTTSFGRGLVDESSANFHGVYKGLFDEEPARTYFDQADLVLVFGPHFSTTNSYASTSIPNPVVSIIVSDTTVEISGKTFQDVSAKTLMVELTRRLQELPKLAQSDYAALQALAWHQPSCKIADLTLKGPIAHAQLWSVFQDFIRPGDIVMGETGTSGYGVREMVVPKGVRVFAPVTWLSIGYMLPAAQGAALAHRELQAGKSKDSNAEGRTILFIGDGSFQMTVQEISTMIRHNLNVIIVVLNNQGYTIERAIHGLNEGYNDIATWRNLRAPEFFGAAEETFTGSARTWGELAKLLDDDCLADSKGLRMIELFLDKEDVPGGPLAHLLDNERKRMIALG